VASLGPAQYNASPAAGQPPGLFTGRCALLGYSAQAGAAAGSIALYDATQQAGLAVAGEALAATSSVTRWFGPQGIEMPRGLLTVLTGANTTATVYYQVLPQD